jgi:Type ISP C-terminal specificity domain
MPIDHRTALAKIKRFDQLVAYLRDEMGWPIARDSFEDEDDWFFEFTAEELGIDPATSAKIEEIKRLRPLVPQQPWGIFFIKFEPKQLPVVALRRILSRVALKKRASANSAERTAWAADDLLFVSNYGEGDERQISFAHFSQSESKDDLPTLKVLGWNNLDTPLHLDDVAENLTHNLAWPTDDSDIEGWRKSWSAAFTLGHREVVTTSRDLSIRLAQLAAGIRDRINTALSIETESGPLTKLMNAFQEALVHDLDADGFADMYAQTIAYGLLSARIANPAGGTADQLPLSIPVTNPFLKELMETFLHVGGRRGGAGGAGIDFDELGVSEVVDLLDHANMEAVVRDFGDRNPEEDPVIHFYELFLREYDPKKRMQRGVFYTPRPVVSYIVRSIDQLLRTKFGLEDGLADTTTWGEMADRHEELAIPAGVSREDHFVQVLDPATGTGTFLVEVIAVIHRTMTAKWKTQEHPNETTESLWNDYVATSLLPRLHGYELLMAPYAIAHVKLGLKLYETGYRFESHERARVYLTNALEPATDLTQQQLSGILPALAHEAMAVNEIKRKRRFTVVIGNPPYSNFGQLNRIPFILDLLGDYKRGLNEKKLNLDDDFIKFFRFGHFLIEQAGAGVLGLITNNTYIDGITHRQMRRSLMDTFDFIHVLDLHGSSSKKEVSPDGSEDVNVFDIQQGVGIGLFVAPCSNGSHQVAHRDLWGARERKYGELIGANVAAEHWTELRPEEPYYFFEPKDFSRTDEYSRWPSLIEVFRVNGPGVKTERDGVSIHWDRDALGDAVTAFKSLPETELRELFGLGDDSRDWKVEAAKADVIANDAPSRYTRILYRPFDVRHIWYSGQTRGFVGTPGYPVMRNMLDDGALGLLGMRQYEYDVPDYCYVFVSRFLIDNRVFVSNRGIANIFPLYTYAGDTQGQGSFVSHEPELNFRAEFLRAMAAMLDLPQSEITGIPEGLTAEAIFYYIYGLLHSLAYRLRYAEFLRIEFPRLPLASNLELMTGIARLGSDLASLHLMESPTLDLPLAMYEGPEAPEVTRIAWADETVWIDAPVARRGQPAASGTIGFCGVREEVWNFQIGGYQVCHKWLKDRKGRRLSGDDIAHYLKIVVAITETIRLMAEIDDVIEEHGGWPDAFVMSPD